MRVPGVELELGGEKRVVAPLNAAAVKQHRKQLETLFSGAVPDLELVARLLHLSLLRNYPDMKLDQVEDWVDFGNVVEIFETLMNVSGMVTAVGNMMRRLQQQMPPAT